MTVNIVEDNQRERSTGGGDGESGGCCSWKLCWWNPPQETVVSEFFNKSSLHGLQYVGQPKRHILERIFWLASFIIGVIAAGFLVYAMIQRYENTPVIVSFQSKEQPINTIPFPAVTICNMNQNTTPCNQMIPLCMFHGIPMECDEEFVPVITDFGKCCTFNMLPLPLIFRNPSNEGKKNVTIFDNPILGSNMYWNNLATEEWSKWNYDNGFVFPPFEIGSKKPYQYYPVKQQGPGKRYGLSILIDPLIDDFYCPMSDAEGIVFTLHKPIEMPNIREFPSVLDTNREIYIKIDPEITFADPDIRDLSSEKRQCYFGKEKKLTLYRPYTRENCIDDCVSNEIVKQCNCSFFDVPRDERVRICNTDLKSKDGSCTEDLVEVIRSYGKYLYCGHCLALCEDIDYKYEATMMTMRNASQIWVDRDRIRKKEDSIPEWVNHKVSIVHFFFGTEATVPKLRKRLYGVTDLIANVGGILGLCLGFSALSLVELLYFVLVRALWKRCNQPNVCGFGRRIRPPPKTCEASNLQNVEAPPTSTY